MTTITVHAEWEDSPEKQLLHDLNIAFAKADVAGILTFFTDDIRWHIIGEEDMRGKASVRKALEAMTDVGTRELIIHSIITQEREGAVSGEIIAENGGRFAFCDICLFEYAAGKRIQTMTSYTVEIKAED